MALSIGRVRHYLREFALEKLFIEELGWDRHAARLTVSVNSQTYTLNALAEKRGVQAFQCQPDAQGNIPNYASRRKIEQQVAKSAFEHLIIYIDAAKTIQIWQWVARQLGQPSAYREQHIHPLHQSGDALIQKLKAITFLLSEEEELNLTGVVFRLRDAFDRDQVTKRFYDHFKREHAAFLGFIQGITDQGDKEWYASLMLNRLMFVYFIQRKGFLDDDQDYLKNRLKLVQQRQGRGQFHTFYRYFLLRLFHEGFAQQPAQRSRDLEDLLGNVPYLNGGLFELHTLEEKHTYIDIPDEAFEHLFGFFDQYDWHLDTRSLSSGREINPEVLGYIFEKYINQKQMGAYYTKEDITEYIAKSTIIPYLFDAAQKTCAIAFQTHSALWQLLQDDPDRYIYEPVRKGVDLVLPEEIARGMADVSQRGGWNRPAAPAFALPTETWREHVARRQRCLEVREKLQAGAILQINDLITYNLDLRQFAQDVISTCEGPELLRAFFQAISAVTVLDPTCGSGAFLFAALRILEPLYEACLDRMQAFVDDLERSSERYHPSKFSDFRRILAEVERHPNRRYFILKSIIVNNLYGVDIMEEAVEICKLRLFLKLVAQVDRVKELEPLPDIDFNIRPGNTLVGFMSIDEIRRAAERDAEGQGRLVYGETEEAIRRLEEDAEIVEREFQMFHKMQTDYGMDAREFAAAKLELRSRLKKLADELDCYLAGEYAVDLQQKTVYDQWYQSHQPFHWITEFYGNMRDAEFNVIIGNPPYVESAKVINQYTFPHLTLTGTGNLFAACAERFVHLAGRNGRIGIILPISAISTPRMLPLMGFLENCLGPLYISNFAVRPGKLFVGVDMNLSIVIGSKTHLSHRSSSYIYSTRYNRWRNEFRNFLFPTLMYSMSMLRRDLLSVPKWGSNIEVELSKKLDGFTKLDDGQFGKNSSESVFYHSGGRYFRKCLREQLSNEYKELRVPNGWGDPIICLLSSSLYYWLWISLSDCYHVTKRDIRFIPLAQGILHDIGFNSLANSLMKDLWENSEVRIRNRADGTRQEEINFNVGKSKTWIDQIDERLAEHFGLTLEEKDFILNFDISYRTIDAD